MQKSNSTTAQLHLKKRAPIFALFDDVRSAYNVGAMFRTSDAALVSQIFLTGITPCPPRPQIDKTALGATDVVPWQYHKNVQSAIDDLKTKNITIVALEITEKSKAYDEIKYDFPLCLAVGSEVSGLSKAVLQQCDAVIKIPMRGRASSLNVATAYGIALFEIIKQYSYAQA